MLSFSDYLVYFFSCNSWKTKQPKVKKLPCYLLLFALLHLLGHLKVSTYLICKSAFWSVHKCTRMTLICWKQSFLFACRNLSGIIPQEVYYAERLQERLFHIKFWNAWWQIAVVMICFLHWYNQFWKNILVLVFQIA